MTDPANHPPVLPQKCPCCGASMKEGFVHAGEDLVTWSRVHRNEVIEFTKDILHLQKPPIVKSFRLSSGEPDPLHACRCENCRLVILAIAEPVNWRAIE